MIETTLYRKDGGFEERVAVREIDRLVREDGCLLWIDATAPTPQELKRLRQELGLHPLAMEDLSQIGDRPRVEQFEGVYVIIFYAVRVVDDGSRLEYQQINLAVGRHFLLTLHAAPIAEIAEVVRRWRENTEVIEPDVGIPLHALLDTLADGYFPCIDRIADRVEAMEDQVFAGLGDEALQTLFALKKDMLNFRRIVAPERDVVNVLLRREQPIFSTGALLYFQDLYDHLVRIADTIDTYRDLLSTALDMYLSVASNHLAQSTIELAGSANELNKTMRVLAAWSIILMSGALVAGIYGMNFKVMPELNWRYGYYLALGIILTLGSVLCLFFRRRGWI